MIKAGEDIKEKGIRPANLKKAVNAKVDDIMSRIVSNLKRDGLLRKDYKECLPKKKKRY